MSGIRIEEDFTKQICGGNIEEIIENYIKFIDQYRSFTVSNLAKSLAGELHDGNSQAHIE